MTDFIRKTIKSKRPNMSESSLDIYTLMLGKLHRVLFKQDSITDFLALKDDDKVIDYLEKYASTTRKNYLNAIIVAMKTDDALATHPSLKRYEVARDGYNKEYEDDMSTNLKSRKQRANWVEWDDFREMCNVMGRDVKRLKLRRRVLMSTHEYVLYGDYVLCKMYESFPLRNDYHDMRVVSKRDLKHATVGNNYLLRSGHDMTLILNEYKTSKKYGEKRIEITGTLRNILRDYLKKNKTGWLFIDEKTDSPLSSNQITRRLQRITGERLGKKVGSTMLRHSYLSDKYAETQEEMKKDSDIMGHSLATQKMYIKKSDDG